MKNITLEQDENLSIKVSYQMLPQEFKRVDLYFSLPIEMGISSKTLDEDNFFHSGINSQCAYYSAQLHLPLVQSRFISQKKGQQDDYRVNLNLYSYQIRIALDTDIKATIKLKEPEIFYHQASELAEQISALLKKLRRYTPPDKKLKPFFENADNYLSWHVEQSFLKLLSKGPKSSEHAEQREFLFDLCRQENEYRIEAQYNSQVTLDDPNRITNKMRLLQRLIEYGVVFQKDTHHLNTKLRKIVVGTVTTLIMAFVMTLVLNARSSFTEVTVVLIATLGIIYGLRETFKDDITNMIWRRIQRGLPKWKNSFINKAIGQQIAYQTLWFEYITQKQLPESVDKLLQKRGQQNKQAAQLLHFRSDTKVVARKFLPGYDEIQQQILFNFTPFVRYLKKGEGRLYTLEGQKISQQGVERRYQINLVLVLGGKREPQQLRRYKVTLNRSGIINIEPMKILDVAAK